MTDDEIYLPLFYATNIEGDLYNIYNRETDCLVLSGCSSNELEKFLLDNDPNHPFFGRSVQTLLEPSSPEESQPFGDIVGSIEQAFAESFFSYELSACLITPEDTSVSNPNYVFECSAILPTKDQISVEFDLELGKQLNLPFPNKNGDVFPNTHTLAREYTSHKNLTSELRPQLQEDICDQEDPYDEAEESLEYLPED